MTNRLISFWSAFAAMALAQTPGIYTTTGSMSTPRYGHTTTLLTTGKVLIAGGGLLNGGGVSSAELYDPTIGTFTSTGNMMAPRAYHKATLLADGNVLLTGGGNREVEFYDPLTGAFIAGPVLGFDYVYSSTLMGDGRVLLTGCTISCSGTAAVEIYDPATQTFAAVDTTIYAVSTATLLNDGRILVTGGCSAQIFDPVAGKFTPTGDMMNQCSRICFGGAPCRFYVYTDTLLPNGNVLLIGSGEDAPVDVEVYDVEAGTFASAGTPGTEYYHAATLLPDGTVFLTGPYDAELYDPANRTFVRATDHRTCTAHTPALLSDGTVLLAGGYSWPEVLGCAAIYRPAAQIAAPVLLSVSADTRRGAVLHAGTGRVVSPDDPARAGEYLEIYLTGLSDGSTIPPQISIGGRMAPVLWFGKTPGFATLNQINVRAPIGVVPGPAVPVRLTYIGRPANEVTIAVQ